MVGGHIKFHRKVCDWEWYKDAVVSRVFFHLLLNANYKELRWMGQVIHRGQIVTSRESLALALDLTEQQIRTAWKKLEKTGEIVKKSTNKFTLITICKYDSYQSSEESVQPTNNQQITNNQPASNQQITTSKEYKEYKEINNISSTSTIAADNEKFLRELGRTDTEFFVNVCMRLNIDSVVYASLLKDFIQECKMREKIHISMADAKTHFIDWSRGELERRNKPRHQNNETNKTKRRGFEITANCAADYDE